MSMTIEQAPVASLKANPRNARTHSKRQIDMLMQSIGQFGFTNPVLVDDDLMILAGHGRVEAAKRLGLKQVPIVRLSHLSAEDKRAYVLADNRLAELAGWDREMLAIELGDLVELDFAVEAIGFEPAEVDLMLAEAREADPNGADAPADVTPAPADGPARVQAGEVWALGRHRLFCGDARHSASYRALMGDHLADAVFTDPPYNVPIAGFVGGLGKAAHREFAMASGEMSKAEFTAFLTTTLGEAAAATKDGAIAFVCMDWRHMGELIDAGLKAFDALKNVCVWTKANGGMGSLYRSQHELVFVFKRGKAAHNNNVELGRHGRNRTNVWAYAGANSFSATRAADLAMHPTVKPVALVEDAIRDVTGRGGLVLDPFAGSGSTLIAAERCGRSARLIELDPAYCDVIIARWEAYTGRLARRGD